jgi:hypothetical protein
VLLVGLLQFLLGTVALQQLLRLLLMQLLQPAKNLGAAAIAVLRELVVLLRLLPLQGLALLIMSRLQLRLLPLVLLVPLRVAAVQRRAWRSFGRSLGAAFIAMSGIAEAWLTPT